MGCVCSKEGKGEKYEKKPSSKVSYSPVKKSQQNKVAIPKSEGKYQKLDLHDDEDQENRDGEISKNKSLSASIGDLKHAIGKKGSGYSLLGSDNEDVNESSGDNDIEDESENEIHIEIEKKDENETTVISVDNKNHSGTKNQEANKPGDDVTADEGKGIGSNNGASKHAESGNGDDITTSVSQPAENGDEQISKENPTIINDVHVPLTKETDDVSNPLTKDTNKGGDINHVNDDTNISSGKAGLGDANETSNENDVIAESVSEAENSNATPRVIKVDKDVEFNRRSVASESGSEACNASSDEIQEFRNVNTSSCEKVKTDTKSSNVSLNMKTSDSVPEAKSITNVTKDETIDASNSNNLQDKEVNVKIGEANNPQTDVTIAEGTVNDTKVKFDCDQNKDPSVLEKNDNTNARAVNDEKENELSTGVTADQDPLEITLEIEEPADDNQIKEDPTVNVSYTDHANGGDDHETQVLNPQGSSLDESQVGQQEDVETNVLVISTKESSVDVEDGDEGESEVNDVDVAQSVQVKTISQDRIIEDHQFSQPSKVASNECISSDDNNELSRDNDTKEAKDKSIKLNTTDYDDYHIEGNGNDVTSTCTDGAGNLNESFNKDERNGIDNHVQEKELTFEKAKSVINASLQFLKNCKDPGSDESWIFMKRLAVASCIVSTIGNDTRRNLANHLVQADFAQLFVNISRYLLANGSKSKSNTPKEDNLKVMKGTCTNFSTGNEFEPLVCELARHGAIGLLFEELDKSFPPKTDHELLHVVHTLNILSNCVRCTKSSVRQTYRNSNAVNILMKYLKSNEIKLKMESLSILAYIVDDKEGDILGKTEGCIPCLIDVLKQAVTAEDYYVHYTIAGEPSGDGVYGLIDTMNRLVVNDSCKRKVVECGGIPTIIEILQIQGSDADDSQLAALETLWKIAYIEKYQQVIIQHILDSNVVPILTGMQSTSFPPPLRNASTGLLWKLELVDISPNANGTDGEQEHILLSYDVDNLKQATKLRGILLAAGFKVWMDENKREGNLLSTMVNALGNCAAVLMCVSLKYKESIYCQTESTFAVELGKPVIPLRIEEFYKVDGWLSSLISTRQLFKAYSDDALEQDIEELIDELVECGCI